jgi:hypothetical protein
MTASCEDGPCVERRSAASIASQPRCLDALVGQQSSQLLARIEHSRLDGISRDSDDLGDLRDRLLVVVNQVADLSVDRRQFRQASLQQRAMVLLVERRLGIARWVGDDRRVVIV